MYFDPWQFDLIWPTAPNKITYLSTPYTQPIPTASTRAMVIRGKDPPKESKSPTQ